MGANLVKAGFVSSAEDWHWTRQFPGEKPVWRDVRFQFGEDIQSCDVLFVYDALPDAYCGRINASYTVFIASEPRNVKEYSSEFLHQFDMILTTDRNTHHKHVLFGQPGLPWHVGIWETANVLRSDPLNLDFFSSYTPAKSKLVSVVSSNKAFTPEHRERLAFVDALKEYFGEQIDYFGRNINSFSDKMEVLSAYRYHIAIENCSIEDYWTEKLADPFLTLTYPIYYGCPNIESYFSEGALTRIDLSDRSVSINKIEEVISSDLAERSRATLEACRLKVLYEYNLFSILEKLALDLVRHPASGMQRPRKIESEKFLMKNRSLLRRSRKRLLRRVGLGEF